MRVLFTFSILLLMPWYSFSQKYILSGYIVDAATGEGLQGASIFTDIKAGATASNSGYYRLSLPKGAYTVYVSSMGYKDTVLSVKMDSDMHLTIRLKNEPVKENAVNITGEKSNNNVSSSQMGTFTLQTKDLKTIPVFMGEPDILKMIQLLPGVQGAGDANTGLYVRGGGPDQNLVMLDGATVYNAGHLLGFFSVFNSDAISDVTFIKGNMPAQYGGRISSVLDISAKDGDMENYHVSGGIGLIASHLTVQGPIKKDTGAFIISARRTYIDIFLQKPFISASSPFYGTKYYFYDLNGKASYHLTSKDIISLSGYYGQDVFSFNDAQVGFGAEIPWGNGIAAFNWTHICNSKLTSTTTLDYTTYDFNFSGYDAGFNFTLFSGIHDYHLKQNFDYNPNKYNHIMYGLEYTLHVFVPSEVSAQEQSLNFNTGSIQKLYGNEGALYVRDEYDLTDRIRIDGGLRYSLFQQIGPFDRYILGTNGITTDTIHYKPFQNIAFYTGLEPRISLRYFLTPSASIKAGYSRNYQYIHLASISSVSLPTDIWFPSTSLVQPQTGNQYAAGFYKNFYNNRYETSVETYYKYMQNLIEYKNGFTPDQNISSNPDENFTFGTGQAYGIEFFFKKRYGNLNGWLGYTLSWTTENFPDLNQGQTFYAKYDRRNDISIVANYKLNDRLTFSSVFVLASGEALTMPIGWFIIEGNLVEEYGDMNNYRMAPYDRLDLAVTYTPDRQKRLAKKREAGMQKDRKGNEQGKQSRWWSRNYKSCWTFSVYNVYDRYNPYFIYFDIKGNVYNGSLTIQAKQVSLFPVLPSLSWNFEF